ncbi:MAG: penicillin-binding transpeptidase domain-containing protein, partial [Alphaproteobacteria bacterium]|nr:penicillin-binding transpeptidase domain-containing protein [Alphaproteobacteria bacterium]
PIVGWREDDTLWKPENYDRKFLGLVPLRLSLETSRNVPTVRLVESIGVRNAIASAQRFGVYPDNMSGLNLSLALGSGETTLTKLTLGYAAFINGGYRHEPKLVDYVQDRYGRLIKGQKAKANMDWDETLTPPAATEKDEPLADAQSLYQIVSILQGAVEMGTGKQARVPGHTIAGKTGTTNDVKDVWFVGFSKDIVAGVWMGYDTPKPMGAGAGSHMSARAFGEFMTKILGNEKNQPFAVPNGLSLIRVNRASGVAASLEPTGTIITEAFKPGQGPNEPSAHNPHPDTGLPMPDAVIGGVF